MPERILFEDSLVTLTTDRVTAGEISLALDEIVDTRLRGGTGIEEKIFLSLIAFFALGVAVVGLVLSDRGELALGLGLAAVTIWIIFQQCELVLITAAGKRPLLRHRDIVYVRKLLNRIDEAVEERRSGVAPDEAEP